MFSASKFWPTRLLGGRAKSQAEVAFVPTTAMAARIVGQTSSSSQATVATSTEADRPNSFDMPPVPFPEEGLSDDAWRDDDAEDAADLARQADRFVPDRPVTTLTDARGKSIRARIINVSSTGVAVEADFSAMPAATITLVGQKPVKLGRTIRRGQVFVFEKPLDPARCNRQLVL